MQKHSSKMQSPKNVPLPLSSYHQEWFYRELVVRFGEYKSPIRSVKQVADSLGLPFWEVVHIVKLDKSKTYLDTDEKDIWAVNRCCKVRA